MTPTITRLDEAETIHVLGDTLRFMGALAGTDLHVLEITVPPGSGTPPHRHASVEIFRVNAGEITFGLFDEGPPRFVTAGPGTVVTVPSGAAHNYTNNGPGRAAMSVVLQASMIAFFRDVGTPAPPPPGPPPAEAIERLLAGCARHGIEILG
jgi:quercetin dioxygenase-like cupin family protein